MNYRNGIGRAFYGAALCWILGGAPAVLADNPVVTIPGVELRVDAALEDNLKALSGRQVLVTLDSGIQVGGRVKAIGSGLLHLENIANKSFMDAIVRLERIEAVETQVRAYERDLSRLK